MLDNLDRVRNWAACLALFALAATTFPQHSLRAQATGDGELSLTDPEWGEPVDGLAYRLRAERSVWQYWQRPQVMLEVRNVSGAAVSAETIASRTFDPALGVTLMQSPPVVPGQREHDLQVNFEYDTNVWKDLPADQSLSIPITIASLWQASRPGVDQPAMLPDHIEIGLGRPRPGEAPEFRTNLLPLHLLPPGADKPSDLEKWLRRYQLAEQPILAGFIPAATTLVEGERIEVVFVVANAGNKNVQFIFGGDYRGVNRHNRFKIEVRDEAGKLLPDPGAAWGDMGGINWPREVAPGRTSTDIIDLQKYRTFPGPGKYTVAATFELATDFDEREKVAIESEFTIDLLPRSEENVAAVLDRLLERCEQTSGRPLIETIGVIAEFGKSRAVPGLAVLARNHPTPVRQAAIAGLAKIPGPESLSVLLSVEPDPEVRRDVLMALGAFDDPEAVSRAITALSDSKVDVKRAAMDALGRMKTDRALEALLKAFESSESSNDTVALLAAMSSSGSDRVFEVVAESLGHSKLKIRNAAVESIIHFNAARAGKALRDHVEDEDMGFRENVIRAIAEKLRQPIDPKWLVPVIKSRNGSHTIGDAPRMLRLYSGDKAAPALISCLDFNNPSVRSYYNRVIIQDQLACRTGLAIPWISDLNSDGTADQVQHNRDVLRRIAVWLDEYESAPWSEPPGPWRLPHDQEAETWGQPVDGVKLRARTNTSVWPYGLPQVIDVEVQSDGGSMHFDEAAKVVEIEVDGQWYTHDPNADMRVVGDWRHYRGNQFQSFQLNSKWSAISDQQRLELEPGEHTVRIRLVVPPDTDRDKMVTSRRVKFRVARAN